VFKLINSMSFGESMFSARFNQQTSKADLYVRDNYVIPLRNQHGKVLTDSRGHHVEAERQRLPGGARWPLGPTC
jgi:hypothetical protein